MNDDYVASAYHPKQEKLKFNKSSNTELKEILLKLISIKHISKYWHYASFFSDQTKMT